MGKTYKDQYTHWSKKSRPKKKPKRKKGHLSSNQNAEKTAYNKWENDSDEGKNFEKFSRKR